jgi:hypothetical protein
MQITVERTAQWQPFGVKAEQCDRLDLIRLGQIYSKLPILFLKRKISDFDLKK